MTKNVYQTNDFDAQVISLAGSRPSESDWAAMLTRLTSGSNIELLHVNFGEILKPQAFTNWIADTWFPQALIDADAATILTGARPVKTAKISEGVVRIIWEDIRPDLTVVRAGELEVRVSPETSSVSAVRLSSDILPGEAQLMEKLLEGINKNVYKKLFCVPLK